MSGTSNRRGFVMLTLLPMMLVIFFSAFSVILASAFAARKNAVMTYQWANEAVSFAANAPTGSGTWATPPPGRTWPASGSCTLSPP